MTVRCFVGQHSYFEIITPGSFYDAQVALSESVDLLKNTPAIFFKTVGWLLHVTALVMQDMAAMFFSLRSLGRKEAIKTAISLFHCGRKRLRTSGSTSSSATAATRFRSVNHLPSRIARAELFVSKTR